jgi:DNA-binding IscR family transcriptional regulator
MSKDIVLKVLKGSKEPLKSKDIAEISGLEKKEVDKILTNLKKEEKISSPKRCFYSTN